MNSIYVLLKLAKATSKVAFVIGTWLYLDGLIG